MLLGEAEEPAYQIDPRTDSTRGQYNLAAVYEEYGKSYGLPGQTRRALDFLKAIECAKAEESPGDRLDGPDGTKLSDI